MIKNNKTKTYNGIILKDEMLSDFSGRKIENALALRLMLVIITSFSGVMSFITATGITAKALLLFIVDAIVAVIICSFKSKNKKIKAVSIGALFLFLAYFFIKRNAIILGFKHILNEYMDAVDAEKLFSGISAVDKAVNINLAFCFLSFLITFGLCFTLFYRFSFLGTFCLTFPFIELGLFWGFVPSHWAFFVLLCVWFIALCSQNCSGTKVKIGDKNLFRKKNSNNVFYSASDEQLFDSGTRASFFCVILSFLVLIVSLIIAGIFNERPERIKNTRSSIKNAVENFKVEDIPMYVDDIMSNFDVNIGIGNPVAGLDNGSLGKDGKLVHKNKDMLEIELSDMFSCEVLYIKGYAGGKYTGDSWEQLDDKIYRKEKDLFEDSDFGFQDYGYVLCQLTDDYLTLDDIMKTQIYINDLTKSRNLYIPYYTDLTTIENAYEINDSYFRTRDNDYLVLFDRNVYSSDSLPMYKLPILPIEIESYFEYEDFVYDNYLDFEEEIVAETYNTIMKKLIKQTKLVYYEGELSRILADFYDFDNINHLFYDYDFTDYDCEEDGFIDLCDYLGNDINSVMAVSEVIQKYLSENYKYTLEPGKTPMGKDFIQYFLEEQKQGYCTYFASAGTMLMRAMGFPARYADGFVAPKNQFNLDDDGVYRATIKDKYAHAWCEVFVPGIGWIPVEFTPGYEQGMMNYENSEEVTTTTTTTTTKNTNTTKPTTTTKITNNAGNVVTSNSGVVATTFTNKTDEKDGEKADYSKIIKTVSIILIVIFVILLVLYLWKKLYDKKRETHDWLISDENRSKAVCEIYKYLSRILNAVGIDSSDFKTDIQNCDDIYKKLEKYNSGVSLDEFKLFTELAVEADMSKNAVSEESYKFAENVYRKICDSIYNSVSPLKKFTIKYFKFLY